MARPMSRYCLRCGASNWYVSPNGKRYCRDCHRERYRRRYHGNARFRRKVIKAAVAWNDAHPTLHRMRAKRAVAAKRAARKSAGLCTRCDAKPRPGYVTCVAHRGRG